MNQFKRAILIVSAGLLIPALSISARPPGGDDGPRGHKHHRKHHRKHMRKLMKKLDLSWSQRRKAREIRKDCRKQAGPDRKMLREKRREIRKMFHADKVDTSRVRAIMNEMKPAKVKLGVLRVNCKRKFHALLNDSQKARMREFHAKRAANKKNRMGKWKKRRERRMKRMRKHLALTDAQVAKIRALHEKNAPARKEHRAKKRELRQAMRALITGATFDESRARSLVEQMVDLRMKKHLMKLEKRGEFREILTAEQRTKMRELHKKRRRGHGRKHRRGRRGE